MFNVTISSGMTSSSFDMDIIDNMVQEKNEMFSITIRLISTCLPITIKSDNTSVTIIDDESMTHSIMYYYQLRPCQINHMFYGFICPLVVLGDTDNNAIRYIDKHDMVKY